MTIDTAPLIAKAHAQAEAAARAAAVTIRELTEPKDHAAAAEIFTRVWALEPGQSLMPTGLMRVMAYEGCYIAGVYDDTCGDRLIGAATAFLASDVEPRGGIHLHSHITGMLPEANGRHAGFALKLHQRAWALSRGLRRVTWTFDPLVRANAYFNMAKLGADATAYLVDFYGDMPDGVNVGQGSDRLLMSWALDSARTDVAANGTRIEPQIEPQNEESLLSANKVLLSGIAPGVMPDSGPPPDFGGPLLCATPAAIQTLRRNAPELARSWRFALRGALTGAMGRGYRITGFTRSGWYLLEQHEENERR
ncbi:GNAT family N-acetyltransferase [Catenulispora pinisilvae]|uniref:GNAT family N-acetyltransferase n=1 Tax=Catenulispora pinisilvae TaxID=2705253 RepID=UPI001891142E|nr:GNAT family N-acetyltransferase [Catenulispora pinisilvae]